MTDVNHPESPSNDGSDQRRRPPGLIDYYSGAAAGGEILSAPSASDATGGQRPLPSTAPPLGLSPRTLHGRKEMKEILHAGLRARDDSNVVVLHGIAGGGKSSLALWLAAQAKDQGIAVHWVRVGEVARSMLAVALASGMDAAELQRVQANYGQVRDAVWRHLEASSQRWLLVFDNADDLRQEDLLGQSGDRLDGTGWIRSSHAGLVVVTTRRGDQQPWGDAAVLHRIESLDSTAGSALLRERAPKAGTEVEAGALSEQLGGLPLALRLAGSYLGDSMARYGSFAEYGAAVRADLELLDAGQLQPGDPDDELAARRSVRSTWELTLRLLDSQGLQAARPVLQMLSCFGSPHPIPLDMLCAGPALERMGPPVSELTQTSLDQIVRNLRTFALVDHLEIPRDGGSADCLAMHPLLAEVVAASRDRTPAPDVFWQAALALAEEFSPGFADADPENRWSLLTPICRHTLERIPDRFAEELATVIDFGNACGVRLIMAGALREAHEMTQRCMDRLVGSGLVGNAEHSTLRLETRFAAALVNQESGNATVTSGELRELLSEARDVLDSDAGFLMVIRLKLAQALGIRGEIADAEQIFLDLLDEHAEGSGVEVEWVTHLGYGQMLDSAGRFDEAEQHLLRAHAILHAESTDDPDDSNLLTVRGALASARVGQGRLLEARDDLTAVLRAQERLYGTDSVMTLQTRVTLMGTLTMMQESDAASAQLSQVLRIQRDALNPEHPLALLGLAALVTTRSGSPNEDTDPQATERTMLEVAIALTRTMGEDNLLVLGVRVNAAVRRCEFDPVGGEEALRILVERQQTLFGTTHTTTLTTRLLHAQAIAESDGDNPRAETLLRELLEDQLRVLGPDHLHTIAVRNTLANTLMRNGDIEGCEEQLSAAIAALATAHGHDHHFGWYARATLVRVLNEQGRHADAERELLDLIGSMQRMGAEGDPLLTLRFLLALVRMALEEFGAAEQGLRDLVLELSMTPDNDYDIAIVHWVLADVLRRDASSWDEAESLLRGIVDVLVELGDPEDDLLGVRLDLGELLHERGQLREAEQQLQLAIAAGEVSVPGESDPEDPSDTDELVVQARRSLSAVASEIAALDVEITESAGIEEDSPAPATGPERYHAEGIEPNPGSDGEPSPAEAETGSWLAYLKGFAAQPPIPIPYSSNGPGPQVTPAPGTEEPEARASATSPSARTPNLGRAGRAVRSSPQLRARLSSLELARSEVVDYHEDRRWVASIVDLLRDHELSDVDRAFVRYRYGRALDDLGFPNASRAQLAAALAVYRRIGRDRSSEGRYCEAAWAVADAQAHGPVSRALAETCSTTSAQLGVDHELSLRLRRASAKYLLAPVDPDAARAELSQILMVRDRIAVPEDRETARVRADLAALSIHLDPAGAADLYGDAVARLSATRGSEHPAVLVVRGARAVAYARAHRTRATPELRAVLRRQLRVRGPGHPEVAGTRVHLAECAIAEGEFDTAREHLDAAINIMRIRAGAAHNDTIAVERMLARLQ